MIDALYRYLFCFIFFIILFFILEIYARWMPSSRCIEIYRFISRVFVMLLWYRAYIVLFFFFFFFCYYRNSRDSQSIDLNNGRMIQRKYVVTELISRIFARRVKIINVKRLWAAYINSENVFNLSRESIFHKLFVTICIKKISVLFGKN